jgi:hypothetical protein
MNEQDYTDKILSRIYGNGRGRVFTQTEFIDVADYPTVRQTIARLAKKGTIRRLMRGIYEYPRYSALLDAPAPPSPDVVAHTIAHSHGWTILPSGLTALNMLGLSTQVPAAWEYFSDGPSKVYRWVGGTLHFMHRTNRETTILSPKTALVVQALKALGEEYVDEKVVRKLATHLNVKERKRALREAKFATAWVYAVLKRVDEVGAMAHEINSLEDSSC